MSHLKNAFKLCGLGIIVWGSYNWVNAAPERAEGLAADTKVKYAADKTDEFFYAQKEALSGHFDDIDLDGKIAQARDDARPIGAAIRRSVNPNVIPGVRGVNWAERNTSFAALIFLLVGGAMIALLAFANPGSISSRR